MGTAKRRVKLQNAERMVAFSDAVVAIALTLLVLPLVDINLPSAIEGGWDQLHHIWEEDGSAIVSFFISWIAIIIYWLVHHRLFADIEKLNGRVIRWNIVWLLAIVFLPFPTNMIGQLDKTVGDERAIVVLYLLDLFIISGSLLMISLSAARDPECLAEGVNPADLKNSLRGYVNVGYLALLVIVACFSAEVALWGLIGIALIGPIVDPIDDRRAAQRLAAA